MKLLWKQFWALLTYCSSKESISEEQWLTKARQFGKTFVHRYQAEDVTPYLHVFIYHVGYYLSKYGCLEMFANYGIEGRHRYNKRIITTGTNGYSTQRTQEITLQQLQRSTRETIQDTESTSKPKKRRVMDWTEKSLKLLPDIDSFFVSE